MLHLFLSTLAMMGLTFLIGFFVAAIIKGIALAADSMDFYSSHLLELQRLRKIKKARARFIQLVWNNSPEEMEALGDSRENWNRGMNSDLRGKQEGGTTMVSVMEHPIKSDRLLLSGHKDDLP